MNDRFTSRVLVLAQDEARLRDHAHLSVVHLIAGLIHEGESQAAKALAATGVTLEKVRAQNPKGNEPSPPGAIPFTPAAKTAFELGRRAALLRGAPDMRPEHLLLGVLGTDTGRGVLAGLGCDPSVLRLAVTYPMSIAVTDQPQDRLVGVEVTLIYQRPDGVHYGKAVTTPAVPPPG